jgi:hypothetical protein
MGSRPCPSGMTPRRVLFWFNHKWTRINTNTGKSLHDFQHCNHHQTVSAIDRNALVSRSRFVSIGVYSWFLKCRMITR